MPAAQLDPHIASPARGRQQERLYRNLIRRSGVDVSPAESWVMWHLGARGPHTSAALAVKLGVDRGSLERLYQTLERRGYGNPTTAACPTSHAPAAERSSRSSEPANGRSRACSAVGTRPTKRGRARCGS